MSTVSGKATRAIWTLALVTLVAMGSAHAQKAPAAIDPARLAAAKELLEAQGGTAQARKAFDQMATALVDQMRRVNPAEAEGLKKFMATNYASDSAKVTAYFSEVLEASTQFYAERCTVEELKAMTQFMKTPTGQKFVLLAPELGAAIAPSLIKFQQQVMVDVQGAAQRGEFKK